MRKTVMAAVILLVAGAISCAGDSGLPAGGDGSAPPPADAGLIPCGEILCHANQVCARPCCGGADLGMACTPPPPFCVDVDPGCASGNLCDCVPPTTCSGGRSYCDNRDAQQPRQIKCWCA